MNVFRVGSSLGAILALLMSGCVWHAEPAPLTAPWRRALDEPNLARRGGPESYRLYTVTDNRIFVIRVEVHSGGTHLVEKTRESRRYDNADHEITTRTLWLSPSDWRESTTLVETAGFWEAPKYIHDKELVFVAGLSCTIEGGKNGRHHVVDRNTLNTTREFSNLCARSFHLAGVQHPYSSYFMEAKRPPPPPPLPPEVQEELDRVNRGVKLLVLKRFELRTVGRAVRSRNEENLLAHRGQPRWRPGAVQERGDLVDVGDGANEPHGTVAARADGDIDGEHAREKRGPCSVAAGAASQRTVARSGAIGCTGSGKRGCSATRAGPAHRCARPPSTRSTSGVGTWWSVAAPVVVKVVATTSFVLGHMFVPGLLAGLAGLAYFGLGLLAVPGLVLAARIYSNAFGLLRCELDAAVQAHQLQRFALCLNVIVVVIRNNQTLVLRYQVNA